jgi:predicted metal-dependent peptidase
MNSKNKIEKAITSILVRHSFFGPAVMSMPWIRDDSKVETACTDGDTVFYNDAFIDTLSVDETIGLVLHEVGHPLFQHLSRLRQHFKMDPLRANMAADYEENQMLTEYNMSAKYPIRLPKDALLDQARFGSDSCESIFKQLQEDEGEKDEDDGDGNGDGNGDGDGDGSSSSSSSSSSAAGAGSTFGEFMPPENPKSESEMDQKWCEIRQSCIQTAKLRGEGGSDFIQRLEKLDESPIDVEQLLSRYVDEFVMSDDSTKPDRRYLADNDVCIAGMDSERIGTMVFVKDTSGSINDEILRSCVAVIQAAADKLNFSRLVVIDADAKVQHVEVYGPHDDIEMYAKGRGGTDFRPTFRYIQENEYDARVVIYLTDGYGMFPSEEPDVSTLWISYGASENRYPFGSVVNLQDLQV